jgi:PAS domain S-box-containing protein
MYQKNKEIAYINSYNKSKNGVDLNHLEIISRILIVDDNRANLLGLNSILKSKGYKIDEALSGEEALMLCLKHNYDLFILDVQMPDMNGFELAENLKSINRTKEIPIIFLTAISKEEKFTIQGYKVGAVDYLKKPINDELLLLKVNLFLELYRQKKSIAASIKSLDKEINIHSKLLEQRTEILDGIFNNASVGIAILSLEGLIIDNNNNFCKIFGCTDNNMVGLNYNDFVKDESAIKIYNVYAKLKTWKHKKFDETYLHITKNGVEKYFNLKASIIKYSELNDCVLIMVDDVNDNLLSQKKILLNEKKLKDIINNISDAIFSVDSDFVITSWNLSCENIYGFSEKEAINQPMDKLLQTEYIHYSHKQITNDLEKKNIWKGEIRQRDKRGGNVFINANYKIIENRENDKHIITILNKDITNIRKNEIELTNALILGEETERKRIATNLHDGLGQYLSGLRMHLQILKGDVDDESYNKLISFINTAIKEYRSVSHNIIPPSLSQDGLEGALKLTCDKLSSGDIKIKFTSNLRGYKLEKVVEIELFRVCQELINNALKHSKAQNINLSASISKSKLFSLSIIDDGCGFDVDKSINAGKKGIGLKNILSRIHLLKGKIKINSEKNKGTEVVIKIRL